MGMCSSGIVINFMLAFQPKGQQLHCIPLILVYSIIIVFLLPFFGCHTDHTDVVLIFTGHTFALGTETFIPRSEWDTNHLVRN